MSFGATGAGPSRPTTRWPTQVSRKLAETRVVTCAAPSYLRRQGRPKTPQDLARHEVVLFRDPLTGLPFGWGFERNGKAFEAAVGGRLMTDDPTTAIEACAAGHGLFQSFAMGLEPWLASGRLVPVLEDWSNEVFPLYAFHPPRHLPPAKVRAFLDLVQDIAAAGVRAEAGSDAHRTRARAPTS